MGVKKRVPLREFGFYNHSAIIADSFAGKGDRLCCIAPVPWIMNGDDMLTARRVGV